MHTCKHMCVRTHTHTLTPSHVPTNTQGPRRPCSPETQSWISQAGTGRLWHQRSCPWGKEAQSAHLGSQQAGCGGGGSERLCQDMEYVARPLEAPSLSHSPFQKDLHKLPKAAGVVIPDSFGITEGLQEGCCLQDLDPKRRCGTCSGGLE